MMHNILIIGDSLSMVRPDQGVRLTATYAYKLQLELENSVVVNASLRANDSSNVLTANYLYETLQSFKPDLIVYFLGVVDCMPRLFTKKERRIVELLMSVKLVRPLVKAVISYKSKKRFWYTRNKLKQYVTLNQWKNNLDRFISIAGDKIIFVNIPSPGAKLKERNYAVEKIVDEYNSILSIKAQANSCKLLDLNKITRENPNLLLDDGYHISAEAHDLIFKELLAYIKLLG
ncbi:MAG TPA: SGNH/GDSL hydrolase family protein [Methylophilus sp.]|nr:SGNH/GDSL hydrolase family protein [Methylophilus sp.]HQQ33325.1 SGNH/GDSL hydrolase family protein [Methylophilus sp.]